MDQRGNRYSVVRSDSSPAKAADDAADAREFGHTVRLQYGPFKIGVPAAMVGAVAAWLVSRFVIPATPADCAGKGDVLAIDAKVSRQADDLRNLTTLVNQYAEREHNDFVMLNVSLARQK